VWLALRVACGVQPAILPIWSAACAPAVLDREGRMPERTSAKPMARRVSGKNQKNLLTLHVSQQHIVYQIFKN